MEVGTIKKSNIVAQRNTRVLKERETVMLIKIVKENWFVGQIIVTQMRFRQIGLIVAKKVSVKKNDLILTLSHIVFY